MSLGRLSPLRVAILLLLTGCASMGNTVAQDLAWERWYKCNRFRGITLKEIKTDGQIWVWSAEGSEITAWRACDSAAAAEQAKGVRTSIPPSTLAVASPQSANAMSAPPVWKRGDECRRDRADSTPARSHSAWRIGLSGCRCRKSSSGGVGTVLASRRRDSSSPAVAHRDAARGSAAVTSAIRTGGAPACGTAAASAATTAPCERGGAGQSEHHDSQDQRADVHNGISSRSRELPLELAYRRCS